MTNLKMIWEESMALIAPAMPNQVSFDTWIKPLSPYKLEYDTFILCTDTQFLQQQVIKKYLPLLENAVSQALERPVKVEIILESQRESFNLFPAVHENTNSDNIIGLNSKYTFDTFVVGEGNRFAHAASLAVAENPADAYNPLFLYGSSGLGKTHLMHAIGNFISEDNPNLKIMYVTSEAFTIELINAIKENKNEEFRNKYRQIDVLLIDDIQFIGGKKQTEEEFFHTFNHLHQANKQIIISSDRPPKEMLTLEERLRTRFEWGLICDISAPDYETRVAILQKKLQTLNVSVPLEVLDYIAQNVNSNIRELEGALTRITAYAKLAGTDITLELAKSTFKEYSEKVNKVYDLDLIKKCVSEYFEITVEDLTSKKKTKEIAYARQMAMYICRELLDYSYTKIAKEFERDHTTVMSNVKVISLGIKNDTFNKTDYTNIIRAIKQD